MRWIVLCGLWGCEGAWCPVGEEVLQGFHTCAVEGEPCDRDTPCAVGLSCASEVMCTIGPCPGTCVPECELEGTCAPQASGAPS